MFLLNITLGGTRPARRFNPQILNALLLVDGVRRDMESLLPQATRQGAVTVSETRIRQWQTSLRTAVSLLNRVPAPLIFPPPAFVTFIRQAVNQINQVLRTLASIPITTPAIFPRRPGRATISRRTLQSMLIDLRQAERLLIRALLAA